MLYLVADAAQALPGVDEWVVTWIVLPLLIFVARLADVSLGTLRIIFVAREYKLLATLIGFCEVLIWLGALQQIVAQGGTWASFIAYAAGYAIGNYLGILVQERIALGTIGVRVITQMPGSMLVDALRAQNRIVTVTPGQGAEGPVSVIYLVVSRRDLRTVIDEVKRFNPGAFFTLEDVRFVSQVGAAAVRP